jgi:Homeodomain-like domain
VLTPAQILLKADEDVAGPRWTDDQIAEALDVNRSTVERVRVRCVEQGLEAALMHDRNVDRSTID